MSVCLCAVCACVRVSMGTLVLCHVLAPIAAQLIHYAYMLCINRLVGHNHINHQFSIMNISVEKICTLYSNAAEQDAGNEEILSQLFMAHVRVNDFQSQQKVALQLYKLKPKNPYYCWAVMSCVLKALRGAESKSPEKKKVMLELAQRMIEKLINEEKMDAEQEVQLYLNILQWQGKYKEALEFLEGPTGKRLYPGAPIDMQVELLKLLNRWPELNVLLKNLLKEK